MRVKAFRAIHEINPQCNRHDVGNTWRQVDDSAGKQLAEAGFAGQKKFAVIDHCTRRKGGHSHVTTCASHPAPTKATARDKSGTGSQAMILQGSSQGA